MLYNESLMNACDKIVRRCTKIADTFHGSAWLYDKLMRYFEKEPSAVSITIPITINFIGNGEATISRDGFVIMRCVK